ncbi:MAG: transporter substrate-binding domain-containing protein [Alphaproteobacteria bacterium]|nr:transporter substrate-binding domain-containing protein [Alphaproteobacteria bacterium]
MKKLFLLLVLLISFEVQAGEVLNRIKNTGVVRCGVRTTANAFITKAGDDTVGIDAEVCKVIATALTGRTTGVQYVPVNNDEGDALLQADKIDVLLAGNPWSMKRELKTKTVFPEVFYYSILAFLAKYDEKATSMNDYAGKKVCVNNQSLTTDAIEAFNKKYSLDFRILKLPTLERAKELLFLGRCDMILERLEILQSSYFKNLPDKVDVVVLPEIVKIFATGPAIKAGDDELFKAIRWLIRSLIAAERKGISAQTVEDYQNTQDPEIQDILFENKEIAVNLGVDPQWIYRTIYEHGNYGEIIDRGLGDKSPLKIVRKYNKLRQNGGLIDAPALEKDK